MPPFYAAGGKNGTLPYYKEIFSEKATQGPIALIALVSLSPITVYSTFKGCMAALCRSKAGHK